jgi:ResB-like family
MGVRTEPVHPPRVADRVSSDLLGIAVSTFRFFASLKLAVFSLTTLASVMAYATFFESRHGTHAAQEWIYRSLAFTLLLAFLGLNVLCAALIRFRWDERQKGWTRRQTGFVITHTGLLVVLLGSWITLQTADEGQVMLMESATTDQMVRTDHSVIRLQRLDPRTGEPERGEELELPFRPGAFSWYSSENASRFATTPHLGEIPLVSNPQAAIIVIASATALAIFLSLRSLPGADHTTVQAARLVIQAAALVAAIFAGIYLEYPEGVVRQDVLTGPDDPVRLVVKDYIAASSPPVWVDDAQVPGPRAIKTGWELKPPGGPRKTYLPLDLPTGQADAGIPACLVELQVNNDRRELWLRRKNDIDEPLFEDLVVGGRPYRLAFDFDRRSIGFDLTLTDFDMGTDPGTQEASSYTSQVVVNDPAQGVEGKAVTITMNEPLRYRGMTFYQQGFRELLDADTGRNTGDKKSVIQVGIDPFWGVKYAGCLTVVLGIFVQFAMRAGVFKEP